MNLFIDELYLFYVNNCHTLSNSQSETILQPSLKQKLDDIIINALNKVAERPLFDNTDLEFTGCQLAYNRNFFFDRREYSHRVNYNVLFRGITLNLSIQFTLDSSSFYLTLLDQEPSICNSRNGIMTSYVEYGSNLIKMKLAKALLPESISRHNTIVRFFYSDNALYPYQASYSCFIKNKDIIKIDFDHDFTSSKENKVIITKNPSSRELIKSLGRSIKNRKSLNLSSTEYGDLIAFVYYLDFFNDNNKHYFRHIKKSKKDDEESIFDNEYIEIYRLLKKEGIFDYYLALAEMYSV